MKGPQLQIDTARFNRMLRDLAFISGADFRDVVRAETQSVLGAAQRGTRAARASDIRRRHNDAKFRSYDGKIYNLRHRYPDRLWRQIQRRRRESLRRERMILNGCRSPG